MTDFYEEREKITVSIFGSCVCRDLLVFSNSDYEVLTDIRYCSPMSIVSKPCFSSPIQLSDFINGEEGSAGNWFRKMLCYDINKTYFSALAEKHGEYLIIDLAESRQALLKLSKEDLPFSTFIVNSPPFRDKSNLGLSKHFFDGFKIDEVSPFDFQMDDWRKSLDYFCKQILSIFEEKKIIIIETMPSNEYIENGNICQYMNDKHHSDILSCKLLLPNLYKIIEELLPNAHVVRMPNNSIGDSSHKWGLHPFHFTKLVYSYLYACVEDIIVNNGVNSNFLLENYQKRLDSEYLSFVINTAKNKNSNISRPSSYLDEINKSNLLKQLGKVKKFFLLFICSKKEAFKTMFKKEKREK